MKNQLLLPYRFKKIGWIILIPTLLMGLLMLLDGFNGIPDYLLPTHESSIYKVLSSQTMMRAINNIVLIGIIVGGILVGCSREKVEDEMISHIRLQSLLIALYVNYGALIIASLLVYDIDYLYVMVYNLFTMLFIFLVVFRWKLWRLKRANRDEE